LNSERSELAMPVFVVDGKQYKVPFKTLFKGNKTICDQIIAEKVT